MIDAANLAEDLPSSKIVLAANLGDDVAVLHLETRGSDLHQQAGKGLEKCCSSAMPTNARK
jgi:hypothetical protein